MKKEWGKRHTCQKCSNAFFDLCRTEIICPKCQTNFIDKVISAKDLMNLNNEFPDSEEDFERGKYSNINIIAKELAEQETKKFIDSHLIHNSFDKNLDDQLSEDKDSDRIAS